MSQPQFSIQYTEPRSRISNFLRYFLAIPHQIVSSVWQIAAMVCTFLQWWVIIITGKRNQSLWNVQRNWLGYAARVQAYSTYMFDKFPNIGAEPNGEPTEFTFEFDAKASRLKTLFRFLLLIPAFIVAMFTGIGFMVCAGLTWLVILFTGKQPRGMFDFMLKFHRFACQLNASFMYMTDDSPKFGA
jgi:hypothetical protein